MGKVVIGLTVSLDGYIAGPNDGPSNPLGDGGMPLFDWWTAGTERIGPDDRFTPPSQSRQVVEEMFACGQSSRAGVPSTSQEVGAGTTPFGHHSSCSPRVIDQNVGLGTDGVLVADGIESALDQARSVANGRDISVGAADVAQQYMKAGLLDEINLNLVPILLGGGVRLFSNLGDQPILLECTRVVESVGVTHLRYRVTN